MKVIYNCQYCKNMRAKRRLADNMGCGLGLPTKLKNAGETCIRVKDSRENPYTPLTCELYEPCMPMEDLIYALKSCYNKPQGVYYYEKNRV